MSMSTGVSMLTELIESLREESITFVFARLHSPISDSLKEAGVLDLVGEDHSYPTVQRCRAGCTGRRLNLYVKSVT